ncbi:hypothetical protein GCM10027161_03810 [Microbispora hainanensis]
MGARGGAAGGRWTAVQRGRLECGGRLSGRAPTWCAGVVVCAGADKADGVPGMERRRRYVSPGYQACT